MLPRRFTKFWIIWATPFFLKILIERTILFLLWNTLIQIFFVKWTRDKRLIAPLSIETIKSAFHANLRSYQLERFRAVSQFCGFEIGTGTAVCRNSLSMIGDTKMTFHDFYCIKNAYLDRKFCIRPVWHSNFQFSVHLVLTASQLIGGTKKHRRK